MALSSNFSIKTATMSAISLKIFVFSDIMYPSVKSTYLFCGLIQLEVGMRYV